METSDDSAAGVAPVGGLIVGAEDRFARAAGGAEEGSKGFGEQRRIAEGEELAGCLRTESIGELRRPVRVVGDENVGIHGGHGLNKAPKSVGASRRYPQIMV